MDCRPLGNNQNDFRQTQSPTFGLDASQLQNASGKHSQRSSVQALQENQEIQRVRFWAAWRSNPVLFGQYACTRRALSQPYELNLPDRFRRWIVFSSNLRGCSSPTP